MRVRFRAARSWGRTKRVFGGDKEFGGGEGGDEYDASIGLERECIGSGGM